MYYSWNVYAIQRSEILKEKGRTRTELHIREKAQRAAARARLDEPDDVHPELHVLGRRARVGIHEEREKNAHVWDRVSR